MGITRQIPSYEKICRFMKILLCQIKALCAPPSIAALQVLSFNRISDCRCKNVPQTFQMSFPYNQAPEQDRCALGMFTAHKRPLLDFVTGELVCRYCIIIYFSNRLPGRYSKSQRYIQ